ncbi:MAG: sensor histidine kinase [Nocardioidaceae bacterium]
MLSGPWQISFGLAALLAAVVAAWSLGLFRRMRATYVEALEDQAKRAEEQREERAKAAAREERARIAREMHDIVAHSLAVIVRQADAGRYAVGGDPAAAEQFLTTVAGIGREALTDMRSLLGVLRRDDTHNALSDGSGPQPTLSDLPELLARLRAAGLTVALVDQGPPVPLERAGELAAYRLVQEALTNVVKHAGAANAEVTLSWDDRGLTVTVTDTGGAARSAGDRGPVGSGLVGMSERLRLAGGHLVAGPRSGDGFLVRGRVPARAGPDSGGGVA